MARAGQESGRHRSGLPRPSERCPGKRFQRHRSSSAAVPETTASPAALPRSTCGRSPSGTGVSVHSSPVSVGPYADLPGDRRRDPAGQHPRQEHPEHLVHPVGRDAAGTTVRPLADRWSGSAPAWTASTRWIDRLMQAPAGPEPRALLDRCEVPARLVRIDGPDRGDQRGGRPGIPVGPGDRRTQDLGTPLAVPLSTIDAAQRWPEPMCRARSARRSSPGSRAPPRPGRPARGRPRLRGRPLELGQMVDRLLRHGTGLRRSARR